MNNMKLYTNKGEWCSDGIVKYTDHEKIGLSVSVYGKQWKVTNYQSNYDELKNVKSNKTMRVIGLSAMTIVNEDCLSQNVVWNVIPLLDKQWYVVSQIPTRLELVEKINVKG